MVSSTAPISTTRAFARASTVHLSSRLLVQSCQEIWPTASCFSLPSMFCTASCLLVKLGEILVILSDCRLGGVGLGILALFHCLELLDGLRRRSLLLCQTGVIGSAPSSSTSSEIVGGAAVSVRWGANAKRRRRSAVSEEARLRFLDSLAQHVCITLAAMMAILSGIMPPWSGQSRGTLLLRPPGIPSLTRRSSPIPRH